MLPCLCQDNDFSAYDVIGSLLCACLGYKSRSYLGLFSENRGHFYVFNAVVP